ncbi:NAD(+) diphosphatase [Oceanicola sp. 502str15]|uniref:NAD(+) diphosphatase n=1 Tax=Oceanicola sp. 502str15 TaxID=2696061 RepID=UPI002094FC92|nr:NAD(+) diphosphatase [Oceanicola sp. 502str15]MCO6383899.1 NAD(+) diphosphatase [Oceanicola sp. 502str15]
MRHAEEVTFGGGGLNRRGDLRADAAALDALARGPMARHLPIWRGKVLMQGPEDAPTLAPQPLSSPALEHALMNVFLGEAPDGAFWFAHDITPWQPNEILEAPDSFLDRSEQIYPGLEEARFIELRAAMAQMTPLDAEIAASARAITGWHATHGFCAKCGAASVAAQAGWERHCAACGAHHFPRTDPVVIMLITHGNSVLMGRSPIWPEGMFSLLAGFMEPGETIEAAVRREVFEESGVPVGPVRYLASQPWPFPASLMIGCHGEATATDITLDPKELEDARWVSREEMLDVFAGNNPAMKPARRGAIAQFLLSNWLADRLD